MHLFVTGHLDADPMVGARFEGQVRRNGVGMRTTLERIRAVAESPAGGTA